MIIRIAPCLLLAGAALCSPVWGQFFAVSDRGSKECAIHRLDAKTHRITASRSLGLPEASVDVTPDGKTLYVLSIEEPAGSYGTDRLLCLNGEDLSVRWEYKVPDPTLTLKLAPELSEVFFDPVAGRVYLSGESYPVKTYVLDPIVRAVVRTNPTSGRFCFHRYTNRLYIGRGWGFAVVDLETGAFTPRVGIPGITVLPLPRSSRFFLISEQYAEGKMRHLGLYDPASGKEIRWTQRIAGVTKVRGIVSSDQKRMLLGARPRDLLIIDVESLAVLQRITAPGLINQFLPAPDGKGVWITVDFSATYRVDDRTGKVLERIPIPLKDYLLVRPLSGR